jgi:tape measure domain-containing protein
MSGITAEERKLLASLKQLQDQLNNAGSTGASAGNKIAGSFANINDIVKALIPTLGAAFAADKLRQFALYAFETAKQFEQMGKTLAFVTGSTQKAQQQLSYMTALAQQLGLNVRALTDGFKGFAAAASFAGVSQENINRQMVAFTKAAAALSMSAEDTKLMFSALGQMYSKNKIQAEELRGQLGERLPGAMELLAKSMNVPVTALDEMLKKGEIITKEVMPAFAKEVELAFGTAANQTDTLTAAQNKMFTSIEIAVTRLMEGGIGDFIKTLFKSVSVIFQYLNVLIQDNLQSQLDANERFRVETEKNTLLAIEQYQKQYKEKTGLEISAAEAAKALLEDSKNGEAAYWAWYQGELKNIEESAGNTFDRILRGAHKAFGALGDVALSPLKLIKALVQDAFAPILYVLDLQKDTDSKTLKLFMDNYKLRGEAINKNSQMLIEAGKTQLDVLKSFAEEGKAIQKQQNQEELDEYEKGRAQRYQKEIQTLELQERIRKLYAEANIENEHKRSQELIRIDVEFNEKKKQVDEKYNLLSQLSETQASKDLRELTKNNFKLRIAENADFNSDIRRNEDKYHKDAYDAAIKQFGKMEEAQKKASQKTEKIAKSDFEKELQTSEDSYSQLIKQLEDSRDEETRREGLTYQDRVNLFTGYTDLLNQTWEDRTNARNDITAKYAAKEVDEFAKMFAMIDKLYEEDYQNSIKRLDRQMQNLETNVDTEQLIERNAMRERMAGQQELLKLDEKQAQERIDLQIYRIQKEAEVNKAGADAGVAEAQAAYQQNLADLRNLEEQKTAITIDYAEQRRQYEIEVLSSVADFASSTMSQIMNLQSAQLDNQLRRVQENADEEIRLAEGNKQRIQVIEQKRKEEEKRIRTQQFEAQRAAAIADVVFKTAPLIAQYLAGVFTGPLAVLALAAQATQIGFILAQPVPEFRKGTQGKPHKGGPAIVGEEGVEKVVTESGRVYYTPPTATLIDLPKGSQVIPNNMLDKQEVYWASNQSGVKKTQQSNVLESKLTEIGGILKGLPIHQINMDERGFEKFVRTERRTTKILNNRFPSKS